MIIIINIPKQRHVTKDLDLLLQESQKPLIKNKKSRATQLQTETFCHILSSRQLTLSI